MATLKRVAEDTPRPIREIIPEVPQWICDIIARLHAKKPADRFQSAEEVAAALRACAAGGEQGRPAWRSLGRVGSALVATAVLFLGGILAAQVIIRVRDKDGRTQEIKLPAGASVSVEQDGKVLAEWPPGPAKTGEVRRFEGHRGEVWAVAFTPSGRHILSGGSDGSVRVWDVATGKQQQRFSGHTGQVYALAVDPNGVWALSADGPAQHPEAAGEWNISLREIRSGKELRRLSGTGPAVTCLALTPDGRRALFGDYDGTVLLFDVENWKEQRRLRTDWGLWSVAFSPDGQSVLTAAGYDAGHSAEGFGNRGPIRLWNLATGNEEHRFRGHEQGVWRAVFTPDGKQVLSAGGDHALRIWDAAGAGERGRLWQTDCATCIAVTTDGKRAVSGGYDRNVRLWDLETRKELYCFEGHTVGVQAVALSPDEKFAVSASHDGTVRLWRLPPANKR
jgi:WD40 repeat protein